MNIMISDVTGRVIFEIELMSNKEMIDIYDNAKGACG